MLDAPPPAPASTDAADPFAISSDVQDLLFREARTARAFADPPVSDDQVAALYDLVKFGPTLMNAQPLRLVVVRSEPARDRLIGHLAEGNKAKTASAPLVVVLAADTDFHTTFPTVFPHNPAAGDAFASDDERRIRTALDQAWLQAGYFIVGVRALGLAAGPMAGFDAAGVDADLLAGTAWRSILVVNIGQPAEQAWHDRLPRLAHDDAVLTL
jgi:3-hydroxypropanoate dehydrogenase